MTRRRWRSLSVVMWAVSMALSLATTSFAQEDGSPVSIGTYRTLHSEILGEDRTLLVNLPKGYDETEIAYPVLFVLYGGQVRGYFAEAVHIVDRLQEAGLIPPLIVVGIENVDRYRDNLPVDRRGEKGGAEAFLGFFEEELIPFVGASYRTKDFRILLGPQAGAAFALYSLMERPGLFDVNITTNPFWNRSAREYLMGRAGDFFTSIPAPKGFIFVTCNTSDDNETTMEYLDKLSAVAGEGAGSGFRMVLNPVEPEDQNVIFSPGLKEGLKAYFSEYKVPETIEIGGLDDLKRYYRNLSSEYGYEVDISDFCLVRQGGRLEERGKGDEAETLYRYAREHYPHNLNSYNRLAGLSSRRGDYEGAIAYYEAFLARRHESLVEQRLNGLRRYVSQSAAYAVEKAIAGRGTEAGIARYREIRSDEKNQLYFSEAEFNTLGYSLVARGDTAAAIEVFKMNVEMYPESANAYDSLGEAYMLDGNTEPAIRNYMKSLELNPDNANAKEKLKELGVTVE